MGNDMKRFLCMLACGMAALLTAACVILGGSTFPPMYYQIEYESPRIQCPIDNPVAVRVWPFSAAAPHGREEMVFAREGGAVSFSRQSLWVAPPGHMIADRLIKDLGVSPLFSRAMPASDPFLAPLNLGGRIHQCTWVESGSTGRARLEVQVDLWRDLPRRQVLFRKRYFFESEPVSNVRAEDFAGAVSQLASRFSQALQLDLCAIDPAGPIPDGGK